MVHFEEGPFADKEFHVPSGEMAVVSGRIADAVAACDECPWSVSSHGQGHYKYSIIEDKKNGKVLADPEVIIRN